MPTKYIARLDNEIVASRTTKNRTYTHAIYATKEGWDPTTNWCSRLDLAQKEARKQEGYGWTARILPAEIAELEGLTCDDCGKRSPGCIETRTGHIICPSCHKKGA